MRKNQPSVSAARFTSAGSSASAGLTSTTRPASGAKTSAAAFTLSTTAQASPAVTSRPGSGSSMNTMSPSWRLGVCRDADCGGAVVVQAQPFMIAR